MHQEFERILAERDYFSRSHDELEAYFRAYIDSSIVRLHGAHGAVIGGINLTSSDIGDLAQAVASMKLSLLSPLGAIKKFVWDACSRENGYAPKVLYVMAEYARLATWSLDDVDFSGWAGAGIAYNSEAEYNLAIGPASSYSSIFPACPDLGTWLYRFAVYAYPLLESGNFFPVDTSAYTGSPSVLVPSTLAATYIQGKYDGIGDSTIRKAVIPYLAYITRGFVLAYGNSDDDLSKVYSDHGVAIGQRNIIAGGSSHSVGRGNLLVGESNTAIGIGLTTSDSLIYRCQNVLYQDWYVSSNSVTYVEDCVVKSSISEAKFPVALLTCTVSDGICSDISYFANINVLAQNILPGDLIVSDLSGATTSVLSAYLVGSQLRISTQESISGKVTVYRNVDLAKSGDVAGFFNSSVANRIRGLVVPVTADKRIEDIASGDIVSIYDAVNSDFGPLDRSITGTYVTDITVFGRAVHLISIESTVETLREFNVTSINSGTSGLVVGSYNRPTYGSIFEVGNGTSKSSLDSAYISGIDRGGFAYSGVCDKVGNVISGLRGKMVGDWRGAFSVTAMESLASITNGSLGVAVLSDQMVFGGEVSIKSSSIELNELKFDLNTGYLSGSLGELSADAEHAAVFASGTLELNGPVDVGAGNSTLGAGTLTVSRDLAYTGSGTFTSNINLGKIGSLSVSSPQMLINGYSHDNKDGSWKQSVLGYGSGARPGSNEVGAGLYSNPDSSGAVLMDDVGTWISVGISKGGAMQITGGSTGAPVSSLTLGSGTMSRVFVKHDCELGNGSAYNIANFDYLLWRDRPNAAAHDRYTSIMYGTYSEARGGKYFGNLHLCAYGVTSGYMSKIARITQAGSIPIVDSDMISEKTGRLSYVDGNTPIYDMDNTTSKMYNKNRNVSIFYSKASAIDGYCSMGIYRRENGITGLAEYYTAFNPSSVARTVYNSWHVRDSRFGKFSRGESDRHDSWDPFNWNLSALCSYDVVNTSALDLIKNPAILQFKNTYDFSETVLGIKCRVPKYSDFQSPGPYQRCIVGSPTGYTPDRDIHGGRFYSIMSTEFTKMGEYIRYAFTGQGFDRPGTFGIEFRRPTTNPSDSIRATGDVDKYSIADYMGSGISGSITRHFSMPTDDLDGSTGASYWYAKGAEYPSYGRMDFTLPKNALRYLSYSEVDIVDGVMVGFKVKPWSTSLTVTAGKSTHKAKNRIDDGAPSELKFRLERFGGLSAGDMLSVSVDGYGLVGRTSSNAGNTPNVNVAEALTLAPVKVSVDSYWISIDNGYPVVSVKFELYRGFVSSVPRISTATDASAMYLLDFDLDIVVNIIKGKV